MSEIPPDLIQGIGYEVKMCTASVQLLRTAPKDDRVGRNAYLEVALLHAANITNLIVNDNFDEVKACTPDFHAALERLRKIGDQVENFLYLTWSRVNLEKPDWMPVAMARDVLAITVAWAGALPPGDARPLLAEIADGWARLNGLTDDDD